MYLPFVQQNNKVIMMTNYHSLKYDEYLILITGIWHDFTLQIQQKKNQFFIFWIKNVKGEKKIEKININQFVQIYIEKNFQEKKNTKETKFIYVFNVQNG